MAQLRWLCRRGMKELDVLLEAYLANVYAGTAMEEQAAFQRLLQMEDPDLYALMLGQVVVQDKEVQGVVDRIRQRA